ncbi:nuclease [Halobacteriales archaeon QS_1_67_19]|nr:MAG: nuclease [Halobacteriales archaeon QS_1_67_19]
MQRRTFLKMAAASAASTAAVSDTDLGMLGTARAAAGSDCDSSEEIPSIEFYSAGSQVDPNYGPLTDESVVAVWAEPSATNSDADGNGDAYVYDDDASIPVASVDGGVYGFGSILLQDSDIKFEYGNEEFVLNAWDAELGGSGTVLWDEGHGQYYDLASCSEFRDYAENNGYAVQATTSLSSDLSNADGVVITSPGDSFSSSELSDLADFVANGGAVFLHDQSDYNGYDETQNLNDIAEYLDLAYRFNDDEVSDADSNYNGDDYDVVTHQFNRSNFDRFGARSGISLDAGTRYTATVTDVTDGDTVDVTVDYNGKEYEIRTLGFDSPETKRNSKYEKVEEWEGVEDDNYLADWGENAKDYGQNELDGETVEIEVDPNEDVFDPFGRLLAYIHYDQDDDGAIDTLYNKDVLEKGYARVYGSSLSKHDEFWQAERNARDNGLRVWQQSDPENTSEVRDRAVEEVFVPDAASVRTADGAIAASRVPVFAESTAYQDLEGGVDYGEIPLVGVDSANRTALMGGLSIDESYRDDVTDYEHEVFLTNLIDDLSDRTGQILMDAGHGQFNEQHSLSNDDAVAYQRYLEGQGIQFEQINDLTTSGDNALSTARAVIITSPRSCFSTAEIDELTDYISNGGAVILMGAGWGKIAPDTRRNVNDLAHALGTDLRLNEDRVLDDSNNIGDPEQLYTTNVNTADFSLWSAYS